MKIDDLKEWCLLAYRVFSNLPERVGPSTKTTYWPEHQRDYADKEKRHRFTPTAVQIESAEKFLDLVNRKLCEDHRRKVWEWAFLKDRFGRMKAHCERLGLTHHEYSKEIRAIFQRLGGVVTAERKGRNRPRAAADGDVIRDGRQVAWRPDAAKPVPTGALAHSMERFKRPAPASMVGGMDRFKKAAVAG